MNNKIFIQIASYRDPELIHTIRDCINNAKNPENLIFSIAWQHSNDDEWDSLYEFKNDKRFKIIDINYKYSKGACWARNLLQQQYDDEDYTLQLDSHHRFNKDWDVELINMYTDLQIKGYEKPLITTYAPSYDPKNDPDGRASIPWKMNFDRFIPEGAIFFLPASIDNYKELTEPIPARFYSAHFAFTTGKFVREVPHDPNYYFHGEEISIAVRAYTWGYDLFHPHKVILWHEYTRQNRTKQWDDDKLWGQRNNNSHLRNRKLFQMDGEIKDIDFEEYDFGKKRTLFDYEKYAGISFKKRAVQKYTLDNNLPPNPLIDDINFEDTLTTKFKHCIDVHKSFFKSDINYLFCAVIFEDKNGNLLYRKDLNDNELNNLMASKDEFLKIWVDFDVIEKPFKYIIWSHSKENGWLDKLEEKL